MVYIKKKVKDLIEYLKEVYLESKRITWPPKKDTVKGTYVVLITVIIAAIFLGIIDVGLAKIIQALLRG
ncbi:MAG: preprotein translocase subunit SecE [Desulfobacterota bacterium]|nr:preprotein translocase subunit SecE [Thermodesulfobacteriota bacterium]MDW8002758.1 preprotein translocase subunit SecE [Deltaproteobacteria bacterium]